MTEHVHEWILRDNHAVCLARNENGNRCYAVLLGPDIIARLNATERFGAERARGIASLLNYGGFEASAAAVLAYANILEGKDD